MLTHQLCGDVGTYEICLLEQGRSTRCPLLLEAFAAFASVSRTACSTSVRSCRAVKDIEHGGDVNTNGALESNNLFTNFNIAVDVGLKVPSRS